MPGLHLFVLFLISLVGCLQIPPIWLTNTYVQSQSYDISTTSINLSTTTSLVTYPFMTAFTAVPYIAYGIFNYEANDFLDQQCFSISSTLYTSSSITLSVSVLQNTNILVLTVRYIAIDGIFPYKLSSFDKIGVNYSNGALTNITSQNSNINYYTNIINYTNLANTFSFSYNYFSLPLLNNKIVLFITSMFSFATQEDSEMLNPLNFKVTTSILSTSTFLINVSFGILAKIQYLQFSIICFDYADVISSNIYQLNYQIMSFPSSGGQLSMPPQFYPNFMIGLIGYSSDRTCAYMNFNFRFLKDTIQMNQTVSTISLQTYQYSVLFMKSWICTNDTYFNITNNFCQSCSVPHCATCQFLTICFICDTGYYLDNITGKCEIITSQCGDGNFTLEQQCDDGNTQSGDGCSSLCKIQGGFLCQTNPVTGLFQSMCYYFDTISVQISYIDKYDYSNSIEIVFKLVMINPSVLNGVDLNKCLSISDPTLFKDYQIRSNEDGTFSLIGTYQKDISNVQIDISLSLAQTGRQIFQRLPVTIYKMIIIPSDNENALFYQESVYKTALIISYLSYVICSLSLFMLIVSLFGNKLVGLEMISVVQISYVSLLSLTPMNPCFKALSSLRFVNGISYYYSSEDYMEDPYTPNGFKGIYLYPQFCKNYNYMLLLILIPYIAAPVCLVLSRTLLKNKRQYLQNLTVRLLCEYAFLGLIYSGYIIAIFFGLEINYGLRDMTEIIGIISTTELVFLVLLLVIYFVLLLKKPEYFGQFMNQFVIMKFHKIQKMCLNQNEKVQPKFPSVFSRFWYNGLIIERLVVGTCLVFMYKIIVSSIVPICVFMLLVMLTIFKKPYNTFLHNIRFILNMIICTGIQAVYLFYKIKSSQSYKQPVWYYLPIFICVLLLICISYNGVIIIKQVRQNYLDWRDKTVQLKEEQNYLMIQMTNREMAKNNERQLNSKENISHVEMKQRKRIQKQLRRQLRLKNKICQKYYKNINVIQEQSKQYSDI